MPARERLTSTEQYLAYVIGAGITLAIIAMLLTSLGTVENSDITTSLLLAGLAIAAVGIGAWLIMVRPWERFDDLTTPHYTGHSASYPPAPETAADIKLGDAVPAGAGRMEPPAPHATDVPAPVALEAVAEPVPTVEAVAEPEPVVEAESESEPATAEPITGEPAPVVSGEPRIDDLTIIEGIGPKIAGALYDVGITSFAQVAALTPAELEEKVKGQHVRMVGHANTWPAQAQFAMEGDLTELEELRKRIKTGQRYDDLIQIEGIGPRSAAALYGVGIRTFEDLSHAAPDTLRFALDTIGLRQVNPGSWAEQARLIVKGDLSGLKALQNRLRGGR